MKRKTLAFVSMMALATGVLLFAAPSISQADPFTVTSVDVTVGGVEFCSTSVAGCPHAIWNLGATGVKLNTGESLVLTQTGGSFNFDSTDPSVNGGAIAFCSAATPCATTNFKVNGTLVAIAGSAGEKNLADNNLDAGGQTNEATNWGLVAKNVLGFAGDVYFGYADNVHTGACNQSGHDADGNCLPSSGTTPPLNIFANATHFIGQGVTFAPPGGANHCTGTADCFDAGAILFYNTQTVVPEPVTMFLGGTGLLLLAYAARRRLFVR
jgi:hypothetical protein